MKKQKAIQNIELKIISILQGATSKEHRMTIRELTARVYEWDNLNGIEKLSEKDIDALICKGATTSKEAAKYRYDRIRTVRDSIFNILKNYNNNFPIQICAPLVLCAEDIETDKRFAKYIDENGVFSDTPIYKDKLIFSSYNEMCSYIERKQRESLNDDKDLIEQTVIDNCIDLSMLDIKSKTAFPEMKQWEIYYNQSYSNVEAFVILSSVINQDSIDFTVKESIIQKLVKSTSDKHFEKFVKQINLDSFKSQETSISENIILHNINAIIKAIAFNKKITFDRVYYDYDYEKKICNIVPSIKMNKVGQKIDNNHRYKCTPFNVFIDNGRYWLLALNDNYNTPDGNFMPCPLDLISNICIVDEDGCSLDEVKFIKKYDNSIEESRLNEYMKTNYEQPEEFDIRVRKNQTSGNLIFRTFGKDFSFVEKVDEFDIIRVKRSPFSIINWAITNSRDVELIPREAKTKERLKKKIEELNNIYNIG